jgi:SPP1 gp7 family putative phage head morphogenesis protein
VFVFRKCERKHAAISKATGKKDATLKRLRSFLDVNEPKTVKWLVSLWDKQQAAVTYKELREAVLNGGISEKQLAKWQKDYAKFVNDYLAPQWELAMTAAADEVTALYPLYLYDPTVGAAQDYIKQHGAELITMLTSEQKTAIQSMVAQAAHYEGMTADSLAPIIRPVIGLTKPQAASNLKYYNAVKNGLLKAHPRMLPENAEAKAREAAAKYAGKQHRYRAMNIARTELAAAYNQGGYGATKDAQDKGYIGECKKIWLTASDERVCEICGKVDDENVNMHSLFSIGRLLPPAHPQCRCAVAYEEIAAPVTPTVPAAGANANAAANTQQTAGTVIPVGTAANNPLPQAGTPIPIAPAPKKGDGIPAEDVFADLSTVPKSAFGVSVPSDSDLLEGQNLSARRINIGGAEYYEVSGKLTETTWETVAKTVKANGHSGIIEFDSCLDRDGNYSTSKVTTVSGRGIGLDSFKMSDNQADFEIYADYNNKDMYGFGGYFRARVPVTADAANDNNAMTGILDKAGLKRLTVSPDAAEELLMRKSRLAWQHAPSRVHEYESLTGNAREKKLDEILASAGISDKRVAALELKEVFPGYNTYVDNDAAASYKNAGLINVWCGTSSPDAVVAMTQEGLVATNYRLTSGHKMYGASPEDDMQTGGSDNVFTRIGVAANGGAKYSHSFLGDDYRLIIDASEMNRTDWYAYEMDNYGESHKNHLETRKTPVDFISSNANSYMSGNEIMFRHGIRPEKIIGISCEYDTLRNNLLDKYRMAGIVEVNGVPIDKFVWVSTEVGK